MPCHLQLSGDVLGAAVTISTFAMAARLTLPVAPRSTNAPLDILGATSGAATLMCGCVESGGL